jgi:branched-chain amino acid transport system substrate-binding protein
MPTRCVDQALWRDCRILAIVGVMLTAGPRQLAAQPKYDPGASDDQITIGNIVPYSGPASAYALIGRTEAAYFRKINAQVGINGRKIKFISYDDAYNPAKSVEQARKLVEDDQVLLTFQTLGTAPNTAIRPYMNERKVPQLFVASGASKWNDPRHFPWTMSTTFRKLAILRRKVASCRRKISYLEPHARAS